MTLKQHLHTHRSWIAAIAIAASLVACGGGSGTPDPLRPYREQTLQWAACDPTILGDTEDSSHEDWAQLGSRLQCTNLRAPMDWAKPDRGDVLISVMRLAAADPAQRRGAIVFNPGGPGGDGLWLALDLFWAFGQSNPGSAQGALQLRLLDSHDMVGFSPRGTGASTRLTCGTNELKRFVDPSPLALTDANLANASYNDRKTAEACRKNPLTPHITTDATARDMDLLRTLLGEDTLNYVGYSYGTELGSWYASLFPDKVGRMVLDSALDFASTPEQGMLALVTARQQLHGGVLLPYAVRHSAHFDLGTRPADTDAQLRALSSPMQGLLNTTLGNLTYDRRQADGYLDTLRAAIGLNQALRTATDPANEAAVHAALRQQVFNAGDSGRDHAVRSRAHALYADYRALYVGFEPSSINLGDMLATYWAVRCSSGPATTDPASWNATVRSSAQTAPWHFFDAILDNVCVHWGTPHTPKPSALAMQGLGVLMVQSQHDAATPTTEANRFFAQLPNAKRVFVPGEFQHGVFPYSDTCVDTTVVSYLLGDPPTARETNCQAKPLAQDAAATPPTPPTPPPPSPASSAPSAPSTAPASAAPAAAPTTPAAATLPPRSTPGAGHAGAAGAANAASAANAPASSPPTEPPTYLDPEKAQALIDRFKAGIGRGR